MPNEIFRIEWELHRTAKGSVIAGYVYNVGGMPAAKVSVLIEGLDASGRPVNSTVGHVIGTVSTFDRAYFEEQVPEATSYRMSLLSFEWLRGGHIESGLKTPRAPRGTRRPWIPSRQE